MTGERGVSTVVGYIVILGITAILITGLLIAGGGFVQDQRETTIREELKVVGQRISGDVSTAERLGTVGDGGDAEIRRALPTDVAGATYTVRITDSGTDGPRLVLNTTEPAVTVSVPIALTKDTAAHEGSEVVESEVTGGDVVIRFTYDHTADPSEVTLQNA